MASLPMDNEQPKEDATVRESVRLARADESAARPAQVPSIARTTALTRMLEDIAPLIGHFPDGADFLDPCIERISTQQMMVERIAHRWSVDHGGTRKTQAIRFIQRAVALLIRKRAETGQGISEPVATADRIAEVVEQAVDDKQLRAPSKESVATEPDIALRSSLAGASVRLIPILEATQDNAVIDVTRACHAFVDHHAKEVVSSWIQRHPDDAEGAKRSQCLMIERATDLWVETYIKTLVDQLPDPVSDHPEAVMDRCPALRDKIEQLEMGHRDSPDLERALYRRIGAHIQVLADSRFRPDDPLCPPARFRAAWVDALDTIAARAWEREASTYLERIEAMSEDEFERFCANEGQQPMPIDGVLHAIDKDARELPQPVQAADSEQVNRVAREKIAVLWGVLEAVDER